MINKIDIVILWVDGSDSNWKDKRKKALGSEFTIDETRYRDYGSLKYLFRSIEKNCSWVNKIHLVTDEQVPEWLDLSHPKINVVDHHDFIPTKYLPTFNSNVIEANLFRLTELSERFILFNDDIYLNNKVKPEDFFVGDKVLDYGIYNKIAPNEEFAHVLVNNLIVINKYFSKKEALKNNWKNQFRLRYGKHLLKNFLLLAWNDIPGYYNHHLPQPHFKSTFNKVYQLEKERFDTMFENKTRKENDMSHWLFRYWNLEEGKYHPQRASFGKYLLLSDTKAIEKYIMHKKTKVICINDVDCSAETFTEYIYNLIQILDTRYPQKSKFEK